MGRDAIIDGDALGERKIVDATPPCSNALVTGAKGADEVELRKGG